MLIGVGLTFTYRVLDIFFLLTVSKCLPYLTISNNHNRLSLALSKSLSSQQKQQYSQTCVQRPPSEHEIRGRCSEVALCYKNCKWDPKIVVTVDKWSLFGGGR